MVGVFFGRLRYASAGAIGFSAAMAIVAAVVLARVDPHASFLTGLLFGLGVGLGALAFGVWQRRVARG